MRRLGYEIEDRRDARGRDCGFEIRGVAGEVLARFSQRSRQRDAAVQAFQEKHGRAPTDNEVAVLVRETRADKLIEISTSQLRAGQRARLAPDEHQTLSELTRSSLARRIELDPPEGSLQYAKDHVFERVSVAKDYEILVEALRHGRGRIDTAELKGALALQEFSGNVLREADEIASAQSLARERDMVACINRGVGAFERLGTGAFLASDRLRRSRRAPSTSC